MQQYVSRPRTVSVLRWGDPLPEGWPDWTFDRAPGEANPVWIVKIGKGAIQNYYDDESFFRDYEKLDAT